MVVTQTWSLATVVKKRIVFLIHNFFPHIRGENYERKFVKRTNSASFPFLKLGKCIFYNTREYLPKKHILCILTWRTFCLKWELCVGLSTLGTQPSFSFSQSTKQSSIQVLNLHQALLKCQDTFKIKGFVWLFGLQLHPSLSSWAEDEIWSFLVVPEGRFQELSFNSLVSSFKTQKPVPLPEPNCTHWTLCYIWIWSLKHSLRDRPGLLPWRDHATCQV